MHRSLLCLAVLLASATPGLCQETPSSSSSSWLVSSEKNPPWYLPAERIAYYATPDSIRYNLTPEMTALTASGRAALDSFVNALPRFPEYLFSGCHDRAHAAYLLLPPELKGRTAKIWIFAPERFTAPVAGAIQLRDRRRSLESQVKWGYHVALAFRTADSLIVFDAALSPQRVLTKDEWFEMMEIPSFAFWSLLPGGGYGFNSTMNASWSPNGQLFNGRVFEYVDTALVQHWIPKALARDAVGEAIAYRNACDRMLPLITKPTDLLNTLLENRAPRECRAVQELFQEEVRSWIRRLEIPRSTG